jgi:uncharacterized protein YdaU (DUF1376 family)
MSSPAFQFYPADFLVGTAEMTPDEVGAYIRLLCYQWARDGLPSDQGKCAGLAGCSREIIAAIWHKFVVGTDGRARNQKLESVRAAQEAFRASRAENGKKGGRPPKPTDNLVVSGSFPVAKPTDNLGESSSSSSSTLSSASTPTPSSHTPVAPKGAARKKKAIDPEKEASFTKFWTEWPQKLNRQSAREAWEKVDTDIAVILASLATQKRSPKWAEDGGRYIPHASTWLNKRRWEDDPQLFSNGHRMSPSAQAAKDGRHYPGPQTARVIRVPDDV